MRRKFKAKTKTKDKDRESGVRKSRHLEGVFAIDFRDAGLLRKFVTERGKILPARLTGANAKQQRQIAQAVRRARVLGLLPF